MKHGKNWLVVTENKEQITLVHRDTKTVKKVLK